MTDTVAATEVEPKLNRAEKRKAIKSVKATSEPKNEVEEYSTTLGKIHNAQLGFCGPEGVMLGLHVEFVFQGNGLYVEKYGGYRIDHQEGFKWTEEDRNKANADLCLYIVNLLKEAKVPSLDALVGRPVSATVKSDFTAMKDWRILGEVL